MFGLVNAKEINGKWRKLLNQHHEMDSILIEKTSKGQQLLKGNYQSNARLKTF